MRLKLYTKCPVNNRTNEPLETTIQNNFVIHLKQMRYVCALMEREGRAGSEACRAGRFLACSAIHASAACLFIRFSSLDFCNKAGIFSTNLHGVSAA